MSFYHSLYEGYSESTEDEPSFDLHDPSEFSVEIDHLYPDDLAEGVDGLARRFARRMLDAQDKLARREQQLGRAVTRSTCMLIDDYYKLQGEHELPGVLLPDVLLPAIAKAEEETGMFIDYLGREGACAEYVNAREDLVQPAEMVLSRFVRMPLPGYNGSQPPAVGDAWLTNGLRSPGVVDGTWQPSQEMGPGGHTVFMDIELFSEKKASKNRIDKHYSCALLAATWQLLRMGLLPNHDRLAVEPLPMPTVEVLQHRQWRDLPAVMQRTTDARPFDAYNTLSILPMRYLKTEAAVGLMLETVYYDERAIERTDKFAEQANLERSKPWERRSYIFE